MCRMSSRAFGLEKDVQILTDLVTSIKEQSRAATSDAT